MITIDTPLSSTGESAPHRQTHANAHGHSPTASDLATSSLGAVARRGATVAATTLAGLSGGFFFTYQISVIRGLAVVDDTTYVQTFQAINDTIRNAPFGIVFFGTVPALAVATAISRRSSRATRILFTTALALAVATVLITFAGNVPLNEQLGQVTGLTGAAATEARVAFEADWNRLNLLRTLTSVAAAITAAAAAVLDRPRMARSGANGRA